jgi:hypothetical protein
VALAGARPILAGTALDLRVYSRHVHFPLVQGEVIFEEPVSGGEMLELSPLAEDEAIARGGLPSCWGVDPDGSVSILRYASSEMHDRSAIDVESTSFLVELYRVAAAFAAAGLHKMLELNLSAYLFPGLAGQVTLELTDEAARTQLVGHVPSGTEGLTDESAACWGLNPEGGLRITGYCAGDVVTTVH